MNFIKTMIILGFIFASAIQAEQQTGILGFSNPVKGFYVFGFKGLKNEDSICTSKYMIPDDRKDLIQLVKVPNNQVLTVLYSHQQVPDGGTRKYCIVTDITSDKSPQN